MRLAQPWGVQRSTPPCPDHATSPAPTLAPLCIVTCPLLDLAIADLPHLTGTSVALRPPARDMLFASPHPMGHYAAPQIKMASMTLGVVQMELERCKMIPGGLVEAHLGCLNK